MASTNASVQATLRIPGALVAPARAAGAPACRLQADGREYGAAGFANGFFLRPPPGAGLLNSRGRGPAFVNHR